MLEEPSPLNFTISPYTLQFLTSEKLSSVYFALENWNHRALHESLTDLTSLLGWAPDSSSKEWLKSQSALALATWTTVLVSPRSFHQGDGFHFPAQVYFSTAMSLILYRVKIACHPRSKYIEQRFQQWCNVFENTLSPHFLLYAVAHKRVNRLFHASTIAKASNTFVKGHLLFPWIIRNNTGSLFRSE